MGLERDIARAILGPIIGFFESIGNAIRDIINNVKDIPKSINYVIDFFKCPLNILTHVDICIGYYLIDILFYIIYYIFIVVPFGIFYCIIILPISATWNFFAQLIGFGRISIYFNEICPFKNTIGKYLEFAIYSSNKKYFFYRTGSDIDNCYCTSGIRKVFNPLQEIFSLPKSKDDGSSGDIQLFVFALIITGILFIPRNNTETLVETTSTIPIISGSSPISSPIPIQFD
jgi:hypothetical protein